MLSLPDYEAMSAALALDLDPRLHKLISDGIADAKSTELLELTHIVVLDRDDTEVDLEEAIALRLTRNPLDGSTYGEPNYQPPWSWLEKHDGYYEAIVTVGNSGFAYLIFVSADSDLASLCRHFEEDPELGEGGGA